MEVTARRERRLGNTLLRFERYAISEENVTGAIYLKKGLRPRPQRLTVFLSEGADDATAEVRDSGVKKGREGLREIYINGLARIRGNNRFEGHIAIEPNITVKGDNASGTWLIYMLFSKPKIDWVQGKNEAAYRKVNGKWKISKMKFTRTLASEPDMFP